MDISKAIRTLREEKRLTQLEIADKLQMERSNYARLEARGNKLSVEQLEQIAGALGVSVLELMTGEPQKVEDTGKVKELEKRIKELETDKHYLSTTIDLVQEKVQKDDTLFLNLNQAINELVVELKNILGEDYGKYRSLRLLVMRTKAIALKKKLLELNTDSDELSET